ncbi:hypothetical protein PY310_07880 [Pseudarthrobacter sp. H3Y2-7]|uniref:hypothetical protein n=1 Tax=Pseudarthrobacter naphthalenicus TaxID=3031328 RepID=UPI0023B12900|nr:hypothetical protein [Pseudarthrobacter sp. H3Y2-7]MDE8668499.1 hypothetical protein [Pseudarthrobacter sp. H3Y2-7]
MQNTPKTIMKWSPSMRGQYVHQATVLMAAGSDPSAPGAAITLELCGSWEHEPPCPLAPHHTDYARNGNDVTLRIVFAAEPDKEGDVRRRIERALAGESLTKPGGVKTNWTYRGGGPAVLSAAEQEQARRIAAA